MAGRSSFGNIRKRPDTGRWQARYQDATGRQHSQSFDTKAEAAKWLRDEAADRQAGTWIDPKDGRTLFDTWAKRWCAAVVHLRPSTLDRDVGYVARYAIPYFEGVELGQIGALEVQAWIAHLLGRGYKPATVRHAANLLSNIMAAAVVARLIPSNPADGVPRPTIERTEMRFLTPQDLWRLHDMMDERYRGAVLLAGYGGLRSGELWALRVGSVNPLRRQVTVTENLVDVNGAQMVGQPKTKAGRRTVPLPRFVIDGMRLDGRAPDDIVFPAPAGAYVRARHWRQRFWLPALEKAQLEGLRFHDLRHTAVALWIEAGASPLDIARRAGHSSVSVVLDRYGHLMPWAEDRVTSALEGLGRPAGAPIVAFGGDASGVGDGLSQ